MKNKTKVIIAAIFSVAALFWVQMVIEDHRADRMITYAKEHNCTWHYDYYVNEEPVCR